MSLEKQMRRKLPSKPVTPSPHGARARANAVQWVRALGLADEPTVAELERADPALYGACVVPDDRPELVDLCAQYFAWLILFDDAIGECQTPADVARLRLAMEAVVSHDAAPDGRLESVGSFVRAVRSLSGREHFVARAPAFRRAFEHSILDYMDGCVREADLRLQKRVPSFSEYQSFRKRTIGALPILDIVALTLPAPLPKTGTAQARIRDVRERAAHLFAWANDILTYKVCRTEKDEEDRLNLVTVLAEERATSIEAAFDEAIGLYGWELERLVADLDPWVSGPDAAVTSRYARAVLTAVDGNVAWYEQSRRYER
jgi:Terpene synthase family 2, C-terminal metal binding